MKKRIILRAIGEVQKVGYRDFVQKTARKLGVVGHVENMRDGSVQIICEGEEPVIEEFKKTIKVKVKFIDVDEIQVVDTPEPTGEFQYFDIKRGEMAEELGERLDVSILYLDATKEELKKEMKEGFGGMNSNIKDVAGKQDIMNNKLGTMNDTLGDIGTQLGDALVRYDSFGKDIGAIRQDITDMKMLASEFREFKDLFAIYVKHQLGKDSE